MTRQRAATWTVLFILGSTGTGKTSVAEALARRAGATALQADDVRLALQRTVTPAQNPPLHYFLTTSDVWNHEPEALAKRLIRVGRIVSFALEPIVGHHLATNRPIVIEGDGILPSLAMKSRFGTTDTARRVSAIVLHEAEEAALIRATPARGRGFDYLTDAEQETRARTSLLYGDWLRREALARGIPTLDARPRETLVERIESALAEAAVAQPVDNRGNEAIMIDELAEY